MSTSPSKINFKHNLSPSYIDFSNYIQGTTDQILNLLDGVEKELSGRKRLKKYGARDATTKLLECKNNISKIVLQAGEQTEKNVPEERPSTSYTGEPDFGKMSKITPLPDNIHMKPQEEFLGKRSPSILRERKEPNMNDKIKRYINERITTEKGDGGEFCSYIDFSLSHPEVKWHNGQPNTYPKYALKIGYTKTGKPLYAGRTWDERKSFLIPAYVDFDEGICYFGKDGQLWTSNNFEVMESKYIAWDDAKGTPVSELPQLAFKAGYNERDQPLYLGRAFIDGAITPGYVEERYVEGAPNNRAFALILPFRGNILRIFDSYEIMLVIPSDRH